MQQQIIKPKTNTVFEKLTSIFIIFNSEKSNLNGFSNKIT